MTGTTQHRPGRNEPCWCGSDTKYKACHLEEDDAKEHAQRDKERAQAEQEQEKHADHVCAAYQPQTHKVPAIQRPDFVVAVRNLASAGQGAWLHIKSPVDLGRDQSSVDLATGFLAQHGVLAAFLLDPSPPVIAATQELLDRMSGRGVFQVEPSGKRLRRYGSTEIVAKARGDGFVAYLSGRGSLDGVVQLLLEASALDAMALGVTGGILATVWPIARLTREIVRNKLALPTPLLEHAPALVAALVDHISQAADQSGHRGAPLEVVQAQAALPYLVGLREAISDPAGQLEGMGLQTESINTLSVQLEAAADGPRWLCELAAAAGDEWDTPEGYWAWVGAARSVAEVAGLLDALPEAAEAPMQGATKGSAVVGIAIAPESGCVAAGAGMAAVRAVAVPPLSGSATVFSDIDLAAQEHATQRRVLHERLAEILDRGEALARERREAEAKLQELDAEEARIDEQQATATAELDAQAEAEAHSRHRAITAILARGAARLDEAATAWSKALLDSKVEGDNAALSQAERTVREYEDMERRGLIDQLPPGLLAQIRQQVEKARTSLRDALGGREPITVAALVAAEEDPGLTLSVGLPISGGDELAPGALQTVVAVAFADVLADAARSMPQIDVVGVDHERFPQGGSVLRLRFSGPPPVTADDCAQYCASLLSDVGESCAPLRAAGVSIEARVEPDLDMEV